MKIFGTNSALGYMEVAYFIETNDKKLLCIFENSKADNFWKPYTVGKIEEDLEACELDEVIVPKHKMVLEQSSLFGTYLFDEFLKQLEN